MRVNKRILMPSFYWYENDVFLSKVPNLLEKSPFFFRGSPTLWSTLGLTFCAIASFLPGSYISTWEWQFSFISYRKISDTSWCFLINEFPCQNQTKSSSRFLPYHIPRATPFSMYSTWPRFVKILYLSYLCVKFQASNRIFTLHFDQYPSSPNSVRGVITVCITSYF